MPVESHPSRTSLRATFALALIATTVAAGCRWFPHRQPPEPQTLDFTHISLHRLGCLRRDCPVYSVTIDGNGDVHYHGERNVAVAGGRTGHADPRALEHLRELLADPELFWMRDSFVPRRAGCGPWTSDGSAAVVDVEAPHLNKHIVHYLACHGAPRLLTRIERNIDRAAGSAVWVYGANAVQ